MQMILMKASTRAYERLNITLPRATVELLDRVTKKGNRSRFIDQAIRELALGGRRAQLRKLLEEEGRVNRDRGLRLAAEWAAVDAETWRVRRRRERVHGAETFGSSRSTPRWARKSARPGRRSSYRTIIRTAPPPPPSLLR